jgi:hypothetical protein
MDELTSNKNLNVLNRTVYTYLVITLYKLINLIYSTDEVMRLKKRRIQTLLKIIIFLNILDKLNTSERLVWDNIFDTERPVSSGLVQGHKYDLLDYSHQLRPQLVRHLRALERDLWIYEVRMWIPS